VIGSWTTGTGTALVLYEEAADTVDKEIEQVGVVCHVVAAQAPCRCRLRYIFFDRQVLVECLWVQ